MKDLSIIIVTFNSSEVIEKCLSKLNTSKYDVIVVDNVSKDDTTLIVKNKFPEVKLIKNDKNIGYGRANNVALRQINTDFALILNPDALITERDIEICLTALKSNKQIALAAPESCGYETNSDKSQTPSEIKYNITSFVIGGVMFMRMEIFRKIGFFDEDFFMFAEDNELCDRVVDNDYINVIINNAFAFHLGGNSSKKSLRTTYRRFWHLGWSKSRYKQKRKGKSSAARATIRLVIIHFAEGVFFASLFKINKAISKFAFSFGCFSFLIGLKAFKKDGNPRG